MNEQQINSNFSSYPQASQSKKTLVVILIVCLICLFVGYFTGKSNISVDSGKIVIDKGSNPNEADYSLLWETLDLLNTKYVDRPLDQRKLMYGAVAGLVNATGDPYTVFFDPDESKKFAEELQGSFDGIGAEIGIKDDQLVVVAPLDGTPAKKAGLMPGDAILAINDESTGIMTVDVAVSKIRGKAGTEVKLTILPKGKREPKEVKIIRAKIEIKSVEFSSKTIDNKKIAVIKMNRFGEDTKGAFDEAVAKVLSGNYNGLILDLRNNPGGYLEIAVAIASNWIESGEIVLKEKGNGNESNEYKATGLNRLKGVKTVVLVNGGSASASEILAGALQDYKLATLVGEKTFGKGSVQELTELKNDSTLKITIAKWFTPKDRGINKIGLEPDIMVELKAEDAAKDLDPQMEKALEIF